MHFLHYARDGAVQKSWYKFAKKSDYITFPYRVVNQHIK